MLIRKFQSGIVAFMLLVMLSIIINNAINMHLHLLNDGTYIVHAHPYNKSKEQYPEEHHHHEGYEFLLIENLSFFTTFSIFTFSPKEITPLKICHFYYEIENFKNQTIKDFNNKSPPFLSLS